MDITLLVESFLGLVSILGVLIFLLLYSNKKREEKRRVKERKVKEKKKRLSFDALVEIIRDKKSSSKELEKALDVILEDYGDIKDFKYYGEVLIRICRHPNTTKDIILNFNRALEKRNPNYAIEINDFIAKGLNSR